MKILESYTAGYYGVDVLPHNTTQRLSITPPSTRRYRVNQILLYLYRTEEATTQNVSRIFVTIQRGAGNPWTIAMVNLYDASVGAHEGVNMTADITLHPGDTLKAYTMDTSTGGKITYWITVDYDAIP